MGKKKVYCVKDCSFTIKEKVILEPVSFDVYEGDFLTITGASGVGKSTLLQILLGFIKPTTGTFEFFGEEVTDKNYKMLRDRSSAVFQEPIFYEKSVDEVLFSPFNFRANSKEKRDIKLLDELIRGFGLSKIDRTRGMEVLSGGEKQLISLIQALLQKKEILILDEISSSLDSKSSSKVFNLLKKQEATVICISHKREWIENSDKVLELKSSSNEDESILLNKEI